MRRPATPAPAATRLREAPKSPLQESPRLSPHTPFDTHKLTKLYKYKHSASSPGLTGRSSNPRQRGSASTPRRTGCPAFAGHDGSISVLVLHHQRQWRLEQNVEIEQHRPVLDVIEIELDALLDFLLAVDLAAPAIDLRPAGNPGLDAVAREIAVDGRVEQSALQFALHGVRAGTDQRQIAFEDDVEELRQFVEAGLADEASDAGDAAVVLGHDLGGERVGLVVVQRTEFVDVDALVVETEPLLA